MPDPIGKYCRRNGWLGSKRLGRRPVLEIVARVEGGSKNRKGRAHPKFNIFVPPHVTLTYFLRRLPLVIRMQLGESTLPAQLKDEIESRFVFFSLAVAR